MERLESKTAFDADGTVNPDDNPAARKRRRTLSPAAQALLDRLKDRPEAAGQWGPGKGVPKRRGTGRGGISILRSPRARRGVGVRHADPPKFISIVFPPTFSSLTTVLLLGAWFVAGILKALAQDFLEVPLDALHPQDATARLTEMVSEAKRSLSASA